MGLALRKTLSLITPEVNFRIPQLYLASAVNIIAGIAVVKDITIVIKNSLTDAAGYDVDGQLLYTVSKA